jgi:hypothetical protein
MRLPLALLAVVSAFALLFAGCGGNGLPHSNQVSVTVSPAQATITANGSVVLTGTAAGFTDSLLGRWWIQESYNLDRNNDCGFLSTDAPPQSGCLYGYVMYDPTMAVPSTATYYAPSAPGTYHVTFEASQFVEFDHLSRTGEATITVQ